MSEAEMVEVRGGPVDGERIPKPTREQIEYNRTITFWDSGDPRDLIKPGTIYHSYVYMEPVGEEPFLDYRGPHEVP